MQITPSYNGFNSPSGKKFKNLPIFANKFYKLDPLNR